MSQPMQPEITVRIRQAIAGLKARGVNQAKIAKAIGVTSGAVTNWKTGGGMDKKYMVLMEKHFGISLNWLLTGRGSMQETQGAENKFHSTSISVLQSLLPDVVSVPVAGEIGGGGWHESNPFNEAIEILYGTVSAVLDRVEAKGAHFALRVVGPSMNKLIPDGSFVVCAPYDLMRSGIADGDVVAVEIKRHGLYQGTLKRVRKIGDGWELHPESTDPRYQQPIRLDETFSHDRDNPDFEIVIRGLVVQYTVPLMR